jgi:hypothetical protein
MQDRIAENYLTEQLWTDVQLLKDFLEDAGRLHVAANYGVTAVSNP